MNNEISEYMQDNPSWYITLSRYPEKYKELEAVYKKETKEDFQSKLDKISLLLDMAEMFM